MPREKMIRVVVSEAEITKAKALANAQGLTLSAYIRHLIIIAKAPKRQVA